MSTILVVDDEIGIRELLSEILSDEGHVVLTAENAAAARALRQGEAPDLVLLDIWMPDTDGVTLLKEWAAGGQLTMPVIMMSGHATIDTAVEATRFGALDFLEKPIALARLLAAVRNGLERGTARHGLAAGGTHPGSPLHGAPPAAVRGEETKPAIVDPPHVPIAPPPPAPPANAASVALDQPLREARDQFERVYFEYHLARESYSMTRVADRAGLERTHLYRKLKQLGIELVRGGRRLPVADEPATGDGQPAPAGDGIKLAS
jgi:DNA-binding NtrC family response regulator